MHENKSNRFYNQVKYEESVMKSMEINDVCLMEVSELA